MERINNWQMCHYDGYYKIHGPAWCVDGPGLDLLDESKVGKEEAYRNAKLMESAPKMLEAMEKLVTDLDILFKRFYPNLVERGQEPDSISVANAIISYVKKH